MLIDQALKDLVSLTGRQWVWPVMDEYQTRAITQRFDVSETVARLLVARGIGLDDIEHFLQPSLKYSLPDPSHFLDMDVAAQRVAAAITTGEMVAIFGDYDVDGATSSALLVRYFRALGLSPLVHIPDRITEGYGPNAKALLALQAKGATLVITVDCGTLSFEPLEAAYEAGLDVIVVDHHIGEARKPKAYAIVNPNRLDETSPHKQLAAVGVAFLLMVAITRELRKTGWFSTHKEPDLKQWLDIVALGTICDVVPLTGVNRAFVAQGLKIMAGRKNTGMRTVMDVATVTEAPNVYTCGFVIGPRINAGGRVGKADLGVRLLSTDDEVEALMLARELEQYNHERRAIESIVMEEALAQAEKANPEKTLLVIQGSGWHSGVIGIVAGRLKERYHKPVAVIALHEGMGKASARSVPGIDFGAAVIAAREAGLLVAGGGHAMAAGFTVEESKLEALSDFLEIRMRLQAQPMSLVRQLRLDGSVSLSGATAQLMAELERLGPFGQGNASIRMVVHGAINLRPEYAGEQHVKTLLVDSMGSARLFGIAFRAKGTSLGEALLGSRGRKVHVAGQFRLQEWNGRQTVSMMIDDIADCQPT